MELVPQPGSAVSQKSEIDDGVPIEIDAGGLYSPFPIRPYQILAAAKEHVAKDVLMCFTSHLGLGKSSNCVWPSLTKICEETGRSRSAVVRGYRVLVEFGFIKVGKWKSPNGWANRYYFQQACYHGNLLNEKAIEFTKVFGECQACRKIVRDPEVGSGLEAFVHYGCGGNVRKLKRLKRELYVPDAVNTQAS